MSLHFLWVREFRNIKNQYFKFTNNYVIDFEINLITGRTRLEISFNPDYIRDFFGPSICQTTAIIGQNGCGKTNVLDFIKHNLPEEPVDFDTDFILVSDNGKDKENCERKIFVPDSLDFTLIDHTHQFEKVFISSPGNSDYKGPDRTVFSDTSFIFYSNVFDGRNEFAALGLKNISTNYLIKEDRERYTQDPYSRASEIDTYLQSELLRNLDFIRSGIAKDWITFPLPHELSIVLISNDLGPLSQRFQGKQLDSVKKLADAIGRVKPEEFTSDNEYFLTILAASAFFNFVLVESHISLNVSSQLLKYIPDYNLRSNEIRHGLISYFKSFISSGKSFIGQHAKGIVSLIAYTKTLLDRKIMEHDIEGRVLFKTEHRKELVQFLKLYNQAKSFTNFIEFKWRDLSSGQQAMLNLFSRFYMITQNNEDSSDLLKSHIIVLIDEGDLYFHPEWQRRFLHILVQYLPKVFSKKSIQLILTSNSPFTAADLPKDNVIFLKEGGNVLKVDEIKGKTYAANIHTLLSNSFFLENGLVGEFAKGKIKLLIERIAKAKANDYLALKTEISFVGEPILETRLQQMLDQRLPEIKGDNLEDMILNLRSQLELLNELKRKADANN